jgi:hypothetical protein
VSPLVVASPELKRLWTRVLKRVHLDFDEQDRRRCERLTQQANDAFSGRDEVALRAVLEPQSPPSHRHEHPDDWEARTEAQQATPPQPTYQPSMVPKQPPTVSGRERSGILWAACAVLCLLLLVIFDALSEMVGRTTSLSFLVLLTAAVLWWITKNSKLSYNHKARWVAAAASGMILIGICVLNSYPRTNLLFSSARAATTQTLASAVERKDSGNSPYSINAHPPQSNTAQNNASGILSRPEKIESLGVYIEAAKNKVAQKWNSSEVDGSTPVGATVYIQFAIRRRGNHEVPTMETSSGSPSLDTSCLRAVDRIQAFDRLPRGYEADSLTVLYHCTYPGSPTTKSAQDSVLLPAQQPPANGPVDGVHGAQHPTNDNAVAN